MILCVKKKEKKSEADYRKFRLLVALKPYRLQTIPASGLLSVEALTHPHELNQLFSTCETFTIYKKGLP